MVRRSIVCVLVLFLLTACNNPASPTPAAPVQPTAVRNVDSGSPKPPASAAALSTATPLASAAALSTSTPLATPSAAPSSPSTPTPPAATTDPKVLVDNLEKAADPDARYQALLLIFKALNIGVYDARTGAAILRGAERNSQDFYLYDFEVKALADALERGTMTDTAYLADFFTGVGIKPSGKPVDPAALGPMLLQAVRSASAAPDDPYALVYLLVRELGLRHAAPYDMLQDVPADKLQFDALQTLLVEADVILPAARQQGMLDGDGGTVLAMNLRRGDGIQVAQQTSCGDMVGDGGILPFGKFETGLAKAATAKLTPAVLHTDPLANMVGVEAMTSHQDILTTHYGPKGHAPDAGKELQFKIKVEMLDDFGDVTVGCGLLSGYTLPKKGPLAGISMAWDDGGLKKQGTVWYDPADKKTNDKGIATLLFKPFDEKRPGAGPVKGKTGKVTGSALYLPAFDKAVKTMPVFQPFKSDSIAWTVSQHRSMSLEIEEKWDYANAIPNAFTIHATLSGAPVYVSLAGQGGTLTGEGNASYTVTMTALSSLFAGGACTGKGTATGKWKVSATGLGPLDFTVVPSFQQGTFSMPCMGMGPMSPTPQDDKPITFSLPETADASTTIHFGSSENPPTVTFTLREK